MFGAAAESELLGLALWQPPLSPEHQGDGRTSRDRALEDLRMHLQTRERVNSGRWRFRRLDGREFDAEFAVIALEFEQPARFCAVLQDVTAQRETEDALRAAKTAAEDSSRAKSAFPANMSHELRTPMNAILGMTHLALDEAMPVRPRGYVEKAHRAARHLLTLVDDVLDMSKIEAGQLELESVDFDVDAVIDKMVDVLGLRAEEKHLELLFRAAPDLPRRLVGDPTQLRQVLVNLGGNAIKFTERGEVTVGLEVAGRHDDTIELHGWVRDTGVGMSAAERERIFQPFVQADVSTTRRFGGSGLGLAICRQLVERMGGRLWVDSTPGQGSTFHFTARFGRSRFAEAPPQAPAIRGRRALLVDDNAAAREVLGAMLESFGVGVEALDSGERAIERVQQSPPGTFAWILLDWKMPGLDGVACALRLLEHADPLKRPWILLVTAFGRDEALAAAGDLPLAGLLQKPVTPSALHDRLAETAAAAGTARPAPARRERPAAAPLQPRAGVAGLRVLVVEDNALNQELARELLVRAGAQVVVAEHGAQALQRVRDSGPFDIVLMDCQMPVMDGYEATRRLRDLPAAATLPIVAMTASALAEDRERAFASGMNGQLTKPLDTERLLEAIATHAGRAAAATAPIDTDAALARCLGQHDLYWRMLQGFRQTQSGFVAGYRHAIGDGRPEDAARALHDLTGLAGTIGATTLQRAAQALRAAPEAQRAAAFAALEQELGRVLGRLEELLRPA
jgi:signal transduction histidine kinase/DNA-binding response OmpR family regulator